MAKLTDYRFLSFDVYGTLVNWETGIFNGLKPLYECVNLERGEALEVYCEPERGRKMKFRTCPTPKSLQQCTPGFATKLGLEPPTAEESLIILVN